uniref:Uncharacterized protein n=1 Tax=Anguilla anguilla TaxID=7936 RepID=A0A0E9WUS9_ANGAN
MDSLCLFLKFYVQVRPIYFFKCTFNIESLYTAYYMNISQLH